MASRLFEAVTTGQVQRVKIFLDSGVHRQVHNERGHNLLVVCLQMTNHHARDRVFRYLLRRGVDYNHVDSSTGRNVFMWAVYLGRLEQTQYLLDITMGDTDLLKHDLQGSTALHYISTKGNVDMLRVVMPFINRYRLDVDVPDSHGMTPYIYAKKLGYTDIADILLIEGGASPQQADHHQHITADKWAELGLRQRIRQFRRKGSRLHRSLTSLPPIKAFSPPEIIVTDPEQMSVKVDLRDSGKETGSGGGVQDWEDRLARRKAPHTHPFLPSRSLESLFPKYSQEKLSDITGIKACHTDPDIEIADYLMIDMKHEERSDLGKIMELLGEQHSPSFREPARPPKPPTPVLPDALSDEESASDKKLKKKKAKKKHKSKESEQGSANSDRLETKGSAKSKSSKSSGKSSSPGSAKVPKPGSCADSVRSKSGSTSQKSRKTNKGT